MKIKWLGHASVLITSESGIKIITDPYKPGYDIVPGGLLSYGEITESADIVVVTHEHPDHNNVAAVHGHPEIIRGAEIGKGTRVMSKGIEFKGISCFHDDVEGNLLGKNTIVCFQVDGLSICHSGDLGHKLSDKQKAELGRIDILLLAVGLLLPTGERKFIINEAGQRHEAGWAEYLINSDIPNQVYDQLMPKVAIPVHFSNEKCSFKLAGVHEFLAGRENVSQLSTSEVEFKHGKLPENHQIIVLRPAL
jgi:L-ascorbate metabolism protein UlaG (beta-lactamase superfamily)